MEVENLELVHRSEEGDIHLIEAGTDKAICGASTPDVWFVTKQKANCQDCIVKLLEYGKNPRPSL